MQSVLLSLLYLVVGLFFCALGTAVCIIAWRTAANKQRCLEAECVEAHLRGAFPELHVLLPEYTIPPWHGSAEEILRRYEQSMSIQYEGGTALEDKREIFEQYRQGKITLKEWYEQAVKVPAERRKAAAKCEEEGSSSDGIS